MSLPFASLAGVDELGPGAVRDLETVCAVHTMFTFVEPDPEAPLPHLAGAVVRFEGSHDGEHWVPITGSDGQLVRYVRANYLAGNGGWVETDPNRKPAIVTATIASDIDRED